MVLLECWTLSYPILTNLSDLLAVVLLVVLLVWVSAVLNDKGGPFQP